MQGQQTEQCEAQTWPRLCSSASPQLRQQRLHLRRQRWINSPETVALMCEHMSQSTLVSAAQCVGDKTSQKVFLRSDSERCVCVHYLGGSVRSQQNKSVL